MEGVFGDGDGDGEVVGGEEAEHGGDGLLHGVARGGRHALGDGLLHGVVRGSIRRSMASMTVNPRSKLRVETTSSEKPSTRQ